MGTVSLTPHETAERLKVTTGTLANWRVRGNGPRYMKYGNKIYYPVSEIDDFERRMLRGSTAEKPRGKAHDQA
jgi:hypothetical protein